MGANFGLLVIRLALGPMIFAHGYNKWRGEGGIAGTTRWFESLGLRPARLHALLAATLEVVVGVLLIGGLATPAACAALVGLMSVAAVTDHKGKGFFVFKGGWEYVVLVAMVAGGLASLGPGAWSLDRACGLHLAGVGWSIACALLGIAAAAGLVTASTRATAAINSP